MSKRFALKRFLGLSQEELAENEALWREENTNENFTKTSAGAEMRGAGVTPSGMQSDLDTLGTTEPDADAPEPTGDTGDIDTGGGDTTV
jgi:hypothetical protein